MAHRPRIARLALIATALGMLAVFASSAFAQTCTVRTQSQLLFMFSSCAAQGQPPGCITPQDMQDLICSIPSVAGGITVLNGDVAATGPGTVAGLVTGLQNRPVSSTLPTIGQFLGWNGSSWLPTTASGGGGGTPGGANTQVQYNNSSAFGGSSGLTLSPTQVTSMSIGLGSDGTGDIWYRSAGGAFTRLPIGTASQILQVTSGLPSWQTVATGGGTVGSGTGPQIAQYPAGTSAVVGGVTVSGDATLAAGGALTIAANAITGGKINNAAVTYAKIQNVAVNSLLGNPTGTPGAPVEIPLGANLSFVAGALAAGGGGTGTAPQAAYFSATNTLTGNTNVSYQSGFTRFNYLTTPGGASVPLAGTIFQGGGPDAGASRFELDAYGGPARYDAACFGGTSGALAAPNAAGIGCGGYLTFAYNGASLIGPLAGMRSFTAEAQSLGHGGMSLALQTTPIGSTTAVDGLTLDSAQNITVAGQAGSGVRCIHVDASGKQSPASGDCATGGSGSVTQVTAGTGLTAAPNPIVTTGTISLANIGANTVLGNPTGSTAAPTTIPISTAAAINTIPEMGAGGTLVSGMIPAINLAASGAGGVTGSLPFTSLSGGTNVSAAMLVGTGASLATTGSGSINATALGGATFAAPGAIGGTTPAAGTFTTLGSTTLTGTTLSGTFAGTPTYSGIPIFTGLGSVTCSLNLVLDATNHLGTAGCPTGGGITGPGSTTIGFVPQWGSTTGASLSAGLPVSTSAAANTIAEMGAGGTLASGMIPAINLAAGGAGGVTGSLPATSLSGTLNAAQVPAYTGDVTSGAGATVNTIAANAVTNAKAAQMAANTIKGNATGALANATDMAAPSCPDTAGNHLNWTSGTGLSCGTTSSGGGAVSVTAATPNVVINPSPGTGTFTVGTTSPINAQSGTSYTILSTDNTKEVLRTAASAMTDTVPQAIGSFPSGFGFEVITGTAGDTLTPTTSSVNGLASLKMGPQQTASWLSDGANWRTALSVPQPPTQTGTTFLRDDMTWQAAGAGSPAFSGITSGTNTTAAMVVGTGASISVTGSGTNNATTLGGATFAAPGPIGGTTASTGAFTTLTDTGITGSTQCVQASSTGLLSGTGSACGSGGGVATVSGTAGQVTATGTSAVVVGLPTTITQAETFSSNLNTTCTALTDAATINTNFALGNCGTMLQTAGTSRTLANPTNIAAGQWYNWIFTEPASGAAATISAYGTAFTFIGGTPVFNTANSAVNNISCQAVSTTVLNCTGGVGTTQILATNGTADQGPGMLGESIRAFTPNATATGTIQITAATPAVVTWTAHQFRCTVTAAQVALGEQCAMPITFSGTLPTGVTAGTIYWVIGSTITTNTFNIATSEANALAGTALATSGTATTTANAAAGVPLTSGNNPVDFAVLQLNSGSWVVNGSVGFLPAGTTTSTILAGWINNITNNQLIGPIGSFQEAASFPAGVTQVRPTGQFTFHPASSLPVYLGGQATFAVSTMAGFGDIRATRPF